MISNVLLITQILLMEIFEIVYCRISLHILIKYAIENNFLYLGLLSAAWSLDREYSTYGLTVLAFDNGQPSLTSAMNLTINVMDVNDHGPAFSRSIYKVDVLENQPPWTVIANVLAWDDDVLLPGTSVLIFLSHFV